jgi:hypothetical protein
VSDPAVRALAYVRGLGAAGDVPVPGARITVSFHPDRLLADGRSHVQPRRQRHRTGRGRHRGFVLPATEFPAGPRGPEAAALARTLSPDLIDAAVLGHAARTASTETRQLLKYLWHILVLRGRPR